MNWFKKRKADTESIDIDAAIEKANTAKSKLSLNTPYVNRVSKYFEERKGKNGFGEDFEFTFNPRTEGNR